MYFPRDEYEDRWRKTLGAARERGHDKVLVWGQSGGNYERCGDVLWLTGYFSNQSAHAYDSSVRVASSYQAVLFDGDDEPHLFGDQLDYDASIVATSRTSFHRNLIEAVGEGLRSRGIEGPLLAVGSDFLPLKYDRMLRRALPRVEFVYDDELVRDLRRFKSPRELDAIREAGRNVSAALQALMEQAMKGGTQADAAAAGMAELARRGGFPHMVPVSSGEGIFQFTGDPVAGYSRDVELKDGDMVRAWVYGPAWQGYWLDPGRTGIVGRADRPRQRDLIEKTIEITTKLIEAIQPGGQAMDVIRLGDRLREEAGSGDDPVARMFPLYGHGVGLFWERPVLGEGMFGEAGTEDRYAVFHEGQTFTVEVFMSWPDVGSAGIEECFIVHEGENELLTTTDLEWW
jgi:Xaa-Pro aminopeptidase